MADTSAGRIDREALKRALDNLHIEDLSIRRALIDVDADCILGIDENKLAVQLKWGAVSGRLLQVSEGRGRPNRVLFIVEVATSVRLIDKETDASVADPTPVEVHPDDDEVKDNPSDAKVRAQVDATFLASYRVADGVEIEQVALDEFAKHNAIYHVWPYWREYVSSALNRAHIRPFTLPMFRFQAPKEPDPAAATAQK